MGIRTSDARDTVAQRGERAEPAEPPDVLVAPMEGEGSVRRHAGQSVGAEIAEVGRAGDAPPAPATRRHDGADDVVTWLDVGDPGTDVLDHAGPLVTSDDREPPRGPEPQMVV